jgi:hypothetical protein
MYDPCSLSCPKQLNDAISPQHDCDLLDTDVTDEAATTNVTDVVHPHRYSQGGCRAQTRSLWGTVRDCTGTNHALDSTQHMGAELVLQDTPL